MCGVNGGQETHRDVWGEWGAWSPIGMCGVNGGQETHRDVWGEWGAGEP